MKEAVKAYPIENFAVPKGIAFTFVDSRNGKLTSASKPYAIREAFVEGTEPSSSRTSASSGGDGDGNGSANSASPAEDGANDVSTEDFFKEDIQ